ncbi:short chain dehydrogenase/ reductase [Xylogone sp. PMI_703]|nr:short chain dehydrogenase/ reductase [Xylogone sp. PMI_703]
MTFDKVRLPGVALLTGAASGIGKGVALCFAAAGCNKIFLGDVNLSGLEGTKTDIFAKYPAVDVRICHVDISDEVSVRSFVKDCVAAFGRIDYANNIAGVVPQRTPIHEVDVQTYDRTIKINEYGTWLCHRAEIEQMMTQDPLPGAGSIRGSIISVSSLAGMNASSGMSHYSSSKHALIGICKTDAQDYGPHGIRVNAVCPGLIDTALFRQTSPPGAAEKMTQVTPLRRLGNAEDIGNAMTWLSSIDASFVTGAVIPIDGGLVLYRHGM